MTKAVEWEKLTWPEAAEAVKKMPTCIVPLGAIEAHGPHMMIDVDNQIAREKCRRVCERTGIILMPTIPIGVVYSLYGYPGSLTISFDTMKSLLKDIVDSLADRGFKIIIFHSHHGGNWSVAKQAVRESSMEHRDLVIASIAEQSSVKRAQELYCTAARVDSSMAHADELETSQALECCPDAVHMDRAICSYLEFPGDYGAVPYVWSDFSKDGMNGNAAVATQEKGKKFIDAEVEAMVKRINEMLSKHL